MLSKGFSLLVLLLLSVVGCLAQVDAVALRYRFEKGKTYRYMVETQVQGIQKIMNHEEGVTVNRTDVVRMEIRDANDSLLKASVSYEGIFGEMQTRQQRSMINGEGIIGKKVEWTFTSRGKTVAIAKVDTFKESPVIGDPVINFRGMILPLPDQLLQVGDTWMWTEPDTFQAMGGKIIVAPEIECKVAGYEDKANYRCLKITYSGKVSIEGNGALQGAEYSMTGESKSEGTVYFVPQEGIVVAQESTQEQETRTDLFGPRSMTIIGMQTVKASVQLLKK